MDREDLKPGAFMCYARINDRDSTLTKLRKNLSDEVEEYIGEKFPIFQDVEDITWGEDWKERIDESLSEVTFFIPIITPSFFKSDYCCDELNRFLDREKKLGRNDLVLPIYYIETPLLEMESEREISDRDSDSERVIKTLAQIINDRQRPSCADWRKLRPKCRNSFESVEIFEALQGLAIQIRDSLNRLPPMGLKPKKTQPPKTHSKPKISHTEIIVDQTQHGDYATISEAIRAANPGDKILVRPGLYQEGLIIDKPLEIVGEGERHEIVVQAAGKDAILFKTTSGRVVNVTIRQMGEEVFTIGGNEYYINRRMMGGGDLYGVDIAQGRIILEDCDISSQSAACVAIHGGADPRLRCNVIHDGEFGVLVWDNGQGILEENDIFGNACSEVRIEAGGNPTLRHNEIHGRKQGNDFAYWNILEIFEENEIFGDALFGITVQTGYNPTHHRNEIRDRKKSVVFGYKNFQGILKEHEIFGSALSGATNQVGVLVSKNGQGILEDNHIYENDFAGVEIINGGKLTIRHNRINRNGLEAIRIYNGSGGVIEDNDLSDNGTGPWFISDDSKSKVRFARNLE